MFKSIQFLVLGLLLLSASCTSKEDISPVGEYYIKFKANGTQIQYQAVLASPLVLFYDPNGPIHQGSILVVSPGSDGTKNAIGISLRNETEFQSGISYEMQNGISYQSVQLARINFTWFDENGNVYNAVILKSSVPNLPIVEDASLRFSLLTNDLAEGTFNALLIGPSTSSGRGDTEVIISEGDFRLPVVKN